MKSCSASVLIRECKGSETRVSLAAVLTNPKSVSAQEGTPNREAYCCCGWHCKLVTAGRKISRQVPYQTEHWRDHEIGQPRCRSYNQRLASLEGSTRTPAAVVVPFTTAKTRKRTNYRARGAWRKVFCYLHSLDYHSSTEPNELIPFAAAWVEQ